MARHILVIALVGVFGLAGRAAAQGPVEVGGGVADAVRVWQAPLFAPGGSTKLQGIDEAVRSVMAAQAEEGLWRTGAIRTSAANQAAAQTAKPRRPILDRVLLGAVGAVGGFYGGASLGYVLDRHVLNPHGGGDDPGLNGAIIGGFSGAILSAIWLARK